MGYRVFSFGRKSHEGGEADEFFQAAEMAMESVKKMHELACEMEDRYGERYFGDRQSYGGRGGYGMRGNYGRRGDYGEREMWDEMEDYGERRRRDSRGRYM